MEQLRTNIRTADYLDKIQIVCAPNISRNALQLSGLFISFLYFPPLGLIPSLLLSSLLSQSLSSPIHFLPSIPTLFPSCSLNPSLSQSPSSLSSLYPLLVSPLFPYCPLSAPIFLPQSTPPLSHPQSLSSFPVSPHSFFSSLSPFPEPSHWCCSRSDFN